MGAVLSSYAGSKDIAAHASPIEEECTKEYDYIICGGGTAGCVLASRLTEDETVTVLVVEAGESDAKQIYSRIPAGYQKLYKSAADWNFETTPQAAAGGRQMFLPRGKMLGGCSAINAQIYQHCAPSDYDDWETKGAKGWGYKSMQKYFRKAENFTPNPDYNIDIDERGNTGVWNTSYPPTNEMSKALLKAGINIGIPESPDLNVERTAAGISRFQATIDSGGTRSSTSAAYLPAKVHTRRNLTILTSTHVTRLLLDSTNKRATGIELAQNPTSPRYHAKAKKEVLVCLGTYATPQLLLVSGIGPRGAIEKVGVEVKVEIDGVGKGLKDHLMAGPVYNTTPGSSSQFLMIDVKSLPSVAKWLYNGTGPLASNGAEIGAFLRSDNIPGAKSTIASDEVNASGPNAPDLEFLNSPVNFMDHGFAKSDPNGDYMTIFAINLRPKSVGTVTVSSDSVFDNPVIDHAYLSDKDGYDLRVLMEGIKLIRRVAKTDPVKDYIVNSYIPEDVDEKTDEELKEFIKNTCMTIYHPECTCKIGPKDKEGVVDSNLFVHGFQNLRICDASIFPDILSGHPQAGVVACAEKCAELLINPARLDVAAH